MPRFSGLNWLNALVTEQTVDVMHFSVIFAKQHQDTQVARAELAWLKLRLMIKNETGICASCKGRILKEPVLSSSYRKVAQRIESKNDEGEKMSATMLELLTRADLTGHHTPCKFCFSKLSITSLYFY